MAKNLLFALTLLFTWSVSHAGQGAANQAEKNYTDPTTGWKQGFWQITAAMKATPGFKPDQVVEEGNYKDNKKTGVWKAFWPNGNTRSEIEYKNNRANGSYILYFENGKVEEEGNWKNNVNQGDFKRYYPNGQVAQEKTFNSAGKTDGKVTYWYENGKKELEFSATNGVEEGELVRYYPNGDVKEKKTFAGGKVNPGSEKEFQMVNPEVKIEDATAKVATMPAGLKVNAASKFDPNGYNKLYDKENRLVMDGQFKAGKLLNGTMYLYDKNGLLEKTEIYKDGKLAGNGQLDGY